MIQFCYPWTLIKFWLTSTNLGSRGYLTKSVKSEASYLKNIPRNFLDWLHRISSTQGVLHQVSQFRKPFKSIILENSFPRTFLFLLLSIKMSVLIAWTLEYSRLTKYKKKSVTEGKDGKCDKWILHVRYRLPLMFARFSLLVLYKIFLRKNISQCEWHQIL